MEEPAAQGRSFTRPLRWSVAAAILVALAVLRYREGYRRGHEPEQLGQPTSRMLVLRVYPVIDLVTPVEGHPSRNFSLDFDPLIDLIVSTVEHESWMANGSGEGEIQLFPREGNLLIAQTHRVHQQVADLLDQLRRLGREVEAKQAITLFHTWAVKGAPASLCPNLAGDGAVGRPKIEHCFAKTVQNIAAVWGAATFHGQREDADFPAWSTAEELACWPRGAGTAYVAIETDANGPLQLILGWRPEKE